MPHEFKQVGGARLGWFNASRPFASLSISRDSLTLNCCGLTYVFPREAIRQLARHKGLFSTGLRIEHAQPRAPKRVVFWTSAFADLARELETLGYAIEK
jgi:hypothetical protein